MRVLCFLVISWAGVLFFFSSASALTNEDHQRFLKESPEYAEAERHLAELWQEIKASLSQEQFDKVRADQRQWLKERDGYVQLAQAMGDRRPAAVIYAANTSSRLLTLGPLLDNSGGGQGQALPKSFKLTNDDHSRYLKESPAYAYAEKSLADAWKKIKLLPEDQLAIVRQDQRQWLKNRGEVARRARIMGDRRPLASIYANNTLMRVNTLEAILAAGPAVAKPAPKKESAPKAVTFGYMLVPVEEPSVTTNDESSVLTAEESDHVRHIWVIRKALDKGLIFGPAMLLEDMDFNTYLFMLNKIEQEQPEEAVFVKILRPQLERLKPINDALRAKKLTREELESQLTSANTPALRKILEDTVTLVDDFVCPKPGVTPSDFAKRTIRTSTVNCSGKYNKEK